MKQVFSALMLAMAAAGTGCALTEAVTPPPPQIGELPAEAQTLFARAVPLCRDPARVKASFPQQRQAIQQEQRQLQVLIEAEQERWQRRRSYLERELNFYEKEVRRTGGNWQITTAAPKPAAPVKVTTDGAFVDQIKRQREREYNEEQFRYFYRKLHRARAYHQKRMRLYQERLDKLTQATQACDTLQVALRKAKEDEALQKNAKAAPPLPVLHIQEVPVEALPLDTLPADAVATETTPGALPEATIPGAQSDDTMPVPVLADAPTPGVDEIDAIGNPPSPLLSEPETMEQLLAQPPAPTLEVDPAAPVTLEPSAQAEPIVGQPSTEAAPVALEPVLPAEPVALEPASQTDTVTSEPAPQAVPVALEPVLQAAPVVSDAAPESLPPVEETMEQLLRQPPPQPWNQVAQPYPMGHQ